MNFPTENSNGEDLADNRDAAEIELRELVYRTLESEGLIPRFKAQLRAAVFTTIEKSSRSALKPASNKLDSEGMNGRICRALVLDWLQKSHLYFTEDVFKVEATGSMNSIPLTRSELLDQLQIKVSETTSEPILYSLFQRPRDTPSTSIKSLPDSVKQSIDHTFLNERISDANRARDHFHVLFSSSFDPDVLDAFLDKNLSGALSKSQYEGICLKWMQSCSGALKPNIEPVKQSQLAAPTPSVTVANLLEQDVVIKPARRSMSVSSSSSSSSPSSSPEAVEQKKLFDFELPTTSEKPTLISQRAVDYPPPPLLNFDDDEDEEDTSASFFSKKNATPAQIDRLKKIDRITQGDETPRTRSTIPNFTGQSARHNAVEYDDESFSQSHSHSIMSSVDDVTVDKVSPPSSMNIDYLENL